MLLDVAPLTYTAPPFPDDAVHDVNVVLDTSVPVMDRVFPSPTDPQITAPFECVDDASEREMFSNTHDVMDTSLDASNIITDLDTFTPLNDVTLTNSSVNVPLDTEKREYPIEESEGVNVMEETVREDPPQMKRESVNEDDELNGLVTTLAPSGLMLTIP